MEDMERTEGTGSPENRDNESPDPAGQDTEAGVVIDFPAAALYLANTYANLLTEQKNIRQWLDGHKVFTTEMAIQELMSITAQSEGERVQTSGLSDQTARIAEKLAAGYVEKRQRQLEREAASYAQGLSYIEWKIGVVEAAMKNRMTKNDAVFFRMMFVRNRTYREIKAAHKGKQIYDHDVRRKKRIVLKAVEDELRFRFCWKEQRGFMDMVVRETAENLKPDRRRNHGRTD